MSVTETSPAPEDLAVPIPLSLNQEFLCAFDKGDLHGAFGHGHTLVHGWRVFGSVDIETLQGALDDVVERHEILRTELLRDPDARRQEIHPASSPELLVRDLSGTPVELRDRRAEEFLNEYDASRFDVRQIPLVKLVLGRFDDTDSVLVLVVHHIATDGWSNQLILRDLAACYATRQGYEADLPPVHQYREFTAWQYESLGSPATAAALEYWREKLRGGQILAVRADRPRDPEAVNDYVVHRFVADAGVGGRVLDVSRALRSSPFIVFVATYNVVLHRLTGVTDLVVPTFTAGRNEERFAESVGPFLNFVPLRTDLAGCHTFADVLDRTRRTCLEAYTYDIPFPLVANEAPELGAPFADPGLSVIAFELLQSAAAKDGERVGDLTYAEIRRRTISQEVCSHIPDGALWALDILPSKEIAGSLKYDKNLFDERTMVALVESFGQVLSDGTATPDAPLTQI
jgi:condensation enzyme